MLREVCGTLCALGAAYFFGHYGLSFAWILLGLLAWAVKEYRSNEKRERILSTRAAVFDEKGAVLARLDSLPAWVCFPDTERVEWVNKVLKQFWPYFNDFLADLIRETIEPILRDSLPSYLNSFRFEKIKLGDIPPRVGGIKAYTSTVARNEVILDLELLYAGDCKFVIGVKGLKAGLEDLQLHGTLRVVIKPLCKELPLFGGLCFFFLNPPALDFNFTKMADFFDMPGLSNLLRSAILDMLCSMMVLPNKYFVPILSGIDNKISKLTVPAGVLRFNISEAKKLMRADVGMLGLGKSDPYTILAVGSQEFKTPYISNTINPVWDYYCEALVDQLHGQSVRIEVMDHDQGSNDDFLGRATLPVYPLTVKGFSDLWIRLEQVDTGHLHLHCQWLALSDDSQALELAEEEVTKLNPKKFRLSTALLIVYVDAAQNLPEMSKSGGELNTQVILTLSDQKKKSRVYKSSRNPIYEENFHFLCCDPHGLTLQLQVVEAKAQKSLGHVSIPLSKLLSEKGMKVDETFNLKDSGDQSKISLVLDLKILKPVRPQPVERRSVSSDSGSFHPEKKSPALPYKEKKDVIDGASPATPCPPSLGELVHSTVNPIMNISHLKKDLLENHNQNNVHKVTEESGINEKKVSPELDGVPRIQLTLRHNTQNNKLFVIVHRAFDLPRQGIFSPNPYVKLYLLVNKRKEQKQKTQSLKYTCNPVYDKLFQFNGLRQDLGSQSVEVNVATKTKGSVFSRSQILGKTMVTLEHLEPNKPVTEWYTLKQVEL